MAIPSGSGTEVLKRITVHGNSNGWATVFTVPSDHIYTLLSIVFCQVAAETGKTISIRLNDGTNDINLVLNHSVGNQETFVFSDKIILTAGDILKVENTSTNGDWWITYIDQHF